MYPAKISSRELLPAPDGPIMAVKSPALNSPFIFFKIVRFSAKKTIIGQII